MRTSNTTRTNTFSACTLTGCGTKVVAMVKRSHQALHCAGVHLMRVIAAAADGIRTGGYTRVQPILIAKSPVSDRRSWPSDEARPSQF